MFSSRVPESLAPNPISRLLERLRSAGVAILDLTVSNPTQTGLCYPSDVVRALATEAALTYDPRPFGLPAARRAVAEDLGRRGLDVSAERIVLTSSTSEAYSMLFKLLCDPGDEVVAPQPSYPLIEHLSRLDGVGVVPYTLAYDGRRWRIDLDEVRGTLSARTRAILVVSPNNPTGSFLSGDELTGLAELARDRSIALVGDEVFADYEVRPHGRPVSVVEQGAALAFALGGLSKAAGLPQLKLAWMALAGPDALVDAARERLEYICDAYLSVAAPVQHASAALFEAGAAVRRQIHARILASLDVLHEAAAGDAPVRLLPVEGGWYAVLQIAADRPEEALVMDLLEHDHVLVHPGYFFDFPDDGYLVVSLLAAPEAVRDGVGRLVARLRAS